MQLGKCAYWMFMNWLSHTFQCFMIFWVLLVIMKKNKLKGKKI